MAIKLKTKVALGGIFLFLLLVLVGGISFYHFNKLITSSKDVLKDNYETVEFGNSMIASLSAWQNDSTKARAAFEENLKKQEANITEPGEAEMTATLKNDFVLFCQYPDSLLLLSALQKRYQPYH